MSNKTDDLDTPSNSAGNMNVFPAFLFVFKIINGILLFIGP